LGAPTRCRGPRALEWREADWRQAANKQAANKTDGQDRIIHRDRGSPVTLYLDTSSLVKLYVTEAGSDVVRQLVDGASVVATSVVAYAETRAALARLRREGALSAAKATLAKKAFEEQWPTYLALEATDLLCRMAGELAERYGLRGFDSIHLASFSEVARRAGIDDTRFSSFDDRLNQTARKLARTI
jgi:predicted nucleic acid-binding protein